MTVAQGIIERGTANRASFRGTGFRLLWLNAVSYQLISAADRFTFVWLVDDTLDAPPWASGFVVFMLGFPVVLFVLLAGALADRGDRRRQLLASQFAGMIVMATTSVLVATGVINVALAAVMAFCFGLAYAFAQPVRMSLVPILVGRERLQRAVVLMTIGSNLATIVGPVVVGGVISGAGVAWALGLQSVLFAVGFALAWHLRVPPRDPSLPVPPPITRRRLLMEVREGLSFVWADGRLRWLFFILGIGGAVMTGSAYLLLPKLAANEFGRSADDAALLFAVMGGGMVVTSLLLLRGLKIRRRGLVFMCAALAATIIEIGQGLAPSYGLLALALLGWGVCGGLFINLNLVLIQEITPNERLGRVVSMQQLSTFGLTPIGALIAGFLATGIGTRATIVAFGTIGAVLVLIALVRAKDLRAQA
jgi:MFS family permease